MMPGSTSAVSQRVVSMAKKSTLSAVRKDQLLVKSSHCLLIGLSDSDDATDDATAVDE